MLSGRKQYSSNFLSLKNFALKTYITFGIWKQSSKSQRKTRPRMSLQFTSSILENCIPVSSWITCLIRTWFSLMRNPGWQGHGGLQVKLWALPSHLQFQGRGWGGVGWVPDCSLLVIDSEIQLWPMSCQVKSCWRWGTVGDPLLAAEREPQDEMVSPFLSHTSTCLHWSGPAAGILLPVERWTCRWSWEGREVEITWVLGVHCSEAKTPSFSRLTISWSNTFLLL